MPPSPRHELLIALCRDTPLLVPYLLRKHFNVSLPPGTKAIPYTENLGDFISSDHKPDCVLRLLAPNLTEEDLVVVEAQLAPNSDKHVSWPLYLCIPRARQHQRKRGRNADLLVLTLDDTVARWCRRSIQLGYGPSVIQPFVLGPSDIPVMTDPDAVRHLPELAILSLMNHQHTLWWSHIAHAALKVSKGLDGGRDRIYPCWVRAILGEERWRKLNGIEKVKPMQFQGLRVPDALANYFIELGKEKGLEKGLHDGREQGLNEGHYKGVGSAILQVLTVRKLVPSKAQRAKIMACSDEGQLKQWLERATLAQRLQDVFVGS